MEDTKASMDSVLVRFKVRIKRALRKAGLLNQHDDIVIIVEIVRKNVSCCKTMDGSVRGNVKKITSNLSAEVWAVLLDDGWIQATREVLEQISHCGEEGLVAPVFEPWNVQAAFNLRMRERGFAYRLYYEKIEPATDPVQYQVQAFEVERA